jgi:glycosyltransferase involved in cell wall biosynthesis
MIVRDNEATLQACLESVAQVCDEIIIVDTGSTDKTIDIAKRFTDKIYSYLWENDFAKARNYSIYKATKDLIFWMDSDDVCPLETLNAIRIISKDNNKKAAWVFTCKSVDVPPPFNRWQLEGFHTRIFPRIPEILFENDKDGIHESVWNSCIRANIEIRKIDFIIEHHGYKDEETVTKKFLRDIRIVNFKKFKEKMGQEPISYFEFRVKDYFCLYYESRTLIFTSRIDLQSGFEKPVCVAEDLPFKDKNFENAIQPEIISQIIISAYYKIEEIEKTNDISEEIKRIIKGMEYDYSEKQNNNSIGG